MNICHALPLSAKKLACLFHDLIQFTGILVPVVSAVNNMQLYRIPQCVLFCILRRNQIIKIPLDYPYTFRSFHRY